MSTVASLKQVEIDASDLRLRTVTKPTNGDKPDVRPDPDTPQGMASCFGSSANARWTLLSTRSDANRILQLMRQHRPTRHSEPSSPSGANRLR